VHGALRTLEVRVLRALSGSAAAVRPRARSGGTGRPRARSSIRGPTGGGRGAPARNARPRGGGPPGEGPAGAADRGRRRLGGHPKERRIRVFASAGIQGRVRLNG